MVLKNVKGKPIGIGAETVSSSVTATVVGEVRMPNTIEAAVPTGS